MAHTHLPVTEDTNTKVNKIRYFPIFHEDLHKLYQRAAPPPTMNEHKAHVLGVQVTANPPRQHVFIGIKMNSDAYLCSQPCRFAQSATRSAVGSTNGARNAKKALA